MTLEALAALVREFGAIPSLRGLLSELDGDHRHRQLWPLDAGYKGSRFPHFKKRSHRCTEGSSFTAVLLPTRQARCNSDDRDSGRHARLPTGRAISRVLPPCSD